MLHYQHGGFVPLLALVAWGIALLPASAWELDDRVIAPFSWLGDGAVNLSIGYALTQSVSARDRRAGREAINAVLTAGATAQLLKFATHERKEC